MNNPKPLVSHHIFLFPFKWDFLPANKSIIETSFAERTPVGKVLEAITDLPWEKSPFTVGLDQKDQYHTFNEYNYFHGYARDVLALNLNEQDTTCRFRYKLDKLETDPIYEITVRNGKDKAPSIYQLTINDILLTWYDVGIGYLAFFLENREVSESKDILRINEFGRRIYPQFLAYVNEEDNANKAEKDQFHPVDAPKNSFLPDKVRLIGLRDQPIEENFSDYNSVGALNGEPFRLPAHLSELLGPKFSVGTRSSKQRSTKASILLNPVIDDRMYVLSYYLPQTGLNELRSYDEQKGQYAYAKDKFWYAYLFVDPDEATTCHSRPMMEKLLLNQTYDRWIEYNREGNFEGQLFGISRYSFMMLADNCDFTQYILINHHRYVYFQMMALALMQRAAILRFAGEAADISEIVKEGGVKISQQKKLIREVYQAYLNFTNKIYFREITPQEQGIELYDMVRDIMEIDTDLHALQKEIEDLHGYALLLEGEKSSQQAERLTWVATIFLPPTLVAAIFGFSNPPDTDFSTSFMLTILISAGIIALIFMANWLLNFKRKP